MGIPGVSVEEGVPKSICELNGVFREGEEWRVGFHLHSKELYSAADGSANLEGSWGQGGLLHGELDVVHCAT